MRWPRLIALSSLALLESRCCPAVDFRVELPAFGPLTLGLSGGADVKAFIGAELGL